MQRESQLLKQFHWSAEIANYEAKRRTAERIAKEVKDGQVIGAGSGSTSFVALTTLAERAQREGLRFSAIPTSHEVAMACVSLGIPTLRPMDAVPDWYFDGADEADPAGNLIKGRGGAMYQEKLILRSSPKTFILVDRSKLVERLGTRFPIPVEVHPMSVRLVEAELLRLGATEIRIRTGSGKDGPVITENGNMIFDVRFASIGAGLEKDIKSITGVLESGLFWGYGVEIITPDS